MGIESCFMELQARYIQQNVTNRPHLKLNFRRDLFYDKMLNYT
jgi:hypothetical protein